MAAAEVVQEPELAPVLLVLRCRNGEGFAVDTSDAQQLPCGYPIDAPFIRCERTFDLLDDYTRVHAQHRRGGAGAVSDIAAWDRNFMEEEVVDTDTLHDLFVGPTTLGIHELSDLCAQKTADALKGRTVGEVKTLLGITDVGMTPQQERDLLENNLSETKKKRKPNVQAP